MSNKNNKGLVPLCRSVIMMQLKNHKYDRDKIYPAININRSEMYNNMMEYDKQ